MAQSVPLQFEIPEMRDQGCVDAVTAAVHRVDPAAKVAADMHSKRVVIGSGAAAQDFAAAIAAAGFEINAAA